MKGFALALILGVIGLAAINPHTGDWLLAYKNKAIEAVKYLVPQGGDEKVVDIKPGSCEAQAQAVTDVQFMLTELAVTICVSKAIDTEAGRMCPRRSSKYQSAFKENARIMCGGQP